MTQVDTELKESKDVMKFTARTHYSFPPLRGKARMGVMDRNAPPTLILPHKDNSINPRRKVSLRGAIATKQSTYRDCFAPYQSLAMTDYNGQSPLLKSRSESKLKRVIISLWLLFIFGLALSPALSQQASGKETVQAVDAIGMTVSDMDRSLEFYSRVLSFKKVSDIEVWGTEYEHLQGIFGLRMRIVRMKLSNEFIELTEYITPKGRPIPVDSRSNDRWFQHIAIVVSDMDKAYQHLRKHKVQHASTGPQRIPDWNEAAAGIRAFYFRDPDGHNLEIIYFPKGKGDPRWQNSGNKLFLGIDHTAIVVEDTEISLKFYRDFLGMKVAGESENYGTEQEHLNNVFGARLRITGLRAETGPGIEFLEYLAPSDGRPIPQDERANDLIHWQTTLTADNAEELAKRLRDEDYTFISPSTITIPDGRLGFNKGFLVRDPDGHVMQIVEKQNEEMSSATIH